MITQEKANWFALYTKSRHEKSVQTELGKRSIESFLPMRTIKRRWSDRTVSVEEPLFKSYLFVKTDVFHKTDVLRSKGAVTFVNARGVPIPVEESVISALKGVMKTDIALDPFPYLEKGDRVYVKSGPFQGLEGFIVRKDDGKCRLVISVSAIKSSIAVEIDSALVEKV